MCPLTVLKHYLARTKELRTPETSDQLLISYTAPHKPVAGDTIRRWIVLALKNAGINTDKYRAHSTRAAATTSALAHAAPVADILNTAGWASAGTFAKFYDKRVDNKFQSSLLGGNHWGSGWLHFEVSQDLEIT